MADDVVVVGASAAGMYAAGALARAGRHVRVLERSRTLEPSARSLIATARLRDYTGDAGIVASVTRFELHAAGRVLTVPLTEPDVIVERRAVIGALHERAQASGVRFETGCRFAGFKPTDDGVGVLSEDGLVAQAAVVIGADGAGSRVAHAAGLRTHARVNLTQAVVDWPSGVARDTSVVWLRPPWFVWLIPDGPDTGCAGIIGSHHELAEFIASRGWRVRSWQGARIPSYGGWLPAHARVGEGDVWLVGDAAGHVKVSTVGGLVTGFRGADAVVDAIVRGSSRGLGHVRRELGGHLLVRRILETCSEDDYARLLERIPAPAAGSITRDDPLRLLWRVACARPSLLWTGLRHLLRHSRT